MRISSLLLVLFPSFCLSFPEVGRQRKIPPREALTRPAGIRPRSTAVDREERERGADGVDRTVLSKLLSEHSTQTRLTQEQVREYDSLIESLPQPPPRLDVNGGWNLLATISPGARSGDNVDFFDADSWRNYFDGEGPSPFQSLVTGSSRVNGLTQWLTDEDFDNVVEFEIGSLVGKLVLKASSERIEDNRRVFKFRNGYFILNTLWNSRIVLPYPVPFKLLGDRAIGYLETTGYDPGTGIRSAVGNKGTKFIFLMSEESPSEEVALAYRVYSEKIEHDTHAEERVKNTGLSKRPVVICPQQFGGKPGDYSGLAKMLRSKGHPVYLVRLSALDWLSITKSAFSEAYIKGELEPSKALPFYFEAISDTIAKIPNGNDYTILSHSIGGWVARAWLGEVASLEERKRCAKYVSLGTPHLSPPEDSIVSKLDQTRGLLKYINDRWPGAFWDNIEYTCVASKGVPGRFGAFDIDSLLAYSSYFALSGEGNIDGDGITPVKAALLEGSRKIVLDNVYHADVLPNPIGSRNIKLIGCKWYADRIEDWADAL